MMKLDILVERLQAAFPQAQIVWAPLTREVTLVLERNGMLETMQKLRDDPLLGFSQMMDLCGVDYCEYGLPENTWSGQRFAVVYHLLSVQHNWRLRVRIFLPEEHPVLDSIIGIWSVANWYEREAFDLFGILFEGHPDLRRLLTDYGFIGHPFRKDFPLSGHVEMRYDPEKKRVVYQPVSIEPRVNVPKIIRHDHRYVTNTDKES